MKTLAIDIETYSSVDLLKSGVYVYTEASDFEILLFSYSVDGVEPRVISLAEGEKIPDEILEAITNPNVLKTAYNANFERVCLAKYLDAKMRPEQWQCTAVLASWLGLPRALADVGKVLGLAGDKVKMKEGKALIQYFSKPCKATKANGGRTRNMPSDAPEKWELYKEYNRQDVVAEISIRNILLKYGFLESEQKLWEIDQIINDRGVLLDEEMAQNAARLDVRIKNNLINEAQSLTGLENPKSIAQIKGWIYKETGEVVESLNKKEIPGLLEKVGYGKVKDFLELRKGLGKTSTAKYDAMLRCKCHDNRIRGLTQFNGANRTGRWAGRLVQMQNLPQNKMDDIDLDNARYLVKNATADNLELLEAIYEPADTLSQLIRTAFIPCDSHYFIVSDFSAIEARVLAWLAGEKWRLDVFNSHGKIYEASAEKMFNLPEGSVTKGSPLRQKGKVAELALGYGGSVGALKAMGALEMGLTEEELPGLVETWRASNSKVIKFWKDVGKAAGLCISTGLPQKAGPVSFRKQGPLLRLKLPSGRELSYVRPKYDRQSNSISYEGILQSGGWGRIESYGAKLVENIVQAVARDCLAVSLERLHEKNIDVVFHVHDEVVCEVRKDSITEKDVANIMAAPISWAKGLPLAADAYICEYYRKD